MAIVPDKSGNVQIAIGSYCTHTRTSAASPNTVLTPAFVGEIVFDLTNFVRWKAVGLTSSSWEPQKAEVT